MSCLLSSTIYGCTEFSVGGVNKLFIANRATITNVYYDASDNEFSTVLSLAPTTADWYEFSVNKEATSAEDVMNISLFGKSYSHKFSTTIIGLNTEKRDTLNQLTDSNNLIIIFQDANDNWWILGEDKGLRVDEFKSKTGSNPQDINSYSLTLSNTTKYKMRAITESFVYSYIDTNSGGEPGNLDCECSQLLTGVLDDIANCSLLSLANCALQ